MSYKVRPQGAKAGVATKHARGIASAFAVNSHQRDKNISATDEPQWIIGPVNDRHEVEAHALANAVVNGDEQVPVISTALTDTGTPRGESSLQRPALVDEALRSGSQALDPETRRFFERRLDYDFGRVRVHAGQPAGQAARALKARAFTTGSDIIFAPGQYSPRSPQGRWLLAHELAHVVQQRSAGSSRTLQRAPEEITFEKPEVITVSAARRASLLKGAGWRQTNIIVTLIDFRGEPMGGMRAFAEFKAPGVAPVTEASDVAGGAVQWSGVWLQPEGTLRLLAVSTGAPATVPQGVTFYRLPEKGPLKFKAVQKSTEVTVSAKNSQEAADKVGVKGTMGVDFEVFKIGGEVSGETSTKTGTEVSLTWKVVMPTGALEVTQI